MRIAVYCASSTAVDPSNLKLGFALGEEIARRGHDLVWGGGAISVMGEVAKGARSKKVERLALSRSDLPTSSS